MQDKDQSLEGLTLLERFPSSGVRLASRVKERLGLTTTAFGRGLALSRELKPLLERQRAVRINIAHAYGTMRLNQILAEEYRKVQLLEAQQKDLVSKFNHQSLGSDESTLNQQKVSVF